MGFLELTPERQGLSEMQAEQGVDGEDVRTSEETACALVQVIRKQAKQAK